MAHEVAIVEIEEREVISAREVVIEAREETEVTVERETSAHEEAIEARE